MSENLFFESRLPKTEKRVIKEKVFQKTVNQGDLHFKNGAMLLTERFIL